MAGAENIPVSGSQALFWAGARLSPSSPLYNMAFRIDLYQELNERAFAAAVERVVAESDALRTVFSDAGGALQARVLDALADVHETIDLRAAEAPKRQAEAWIQQRVRRPFDLSTGSLSSTLLLLDESHSVWLLNQHHISTDAWSASLIYARVALYYRQLCQSAEVPAATEQWPLFASHLQRETAAQDSRRLLQARAHWQHREQRSHLSLYGHPPGNSDGQARRLTVALGQQRCDRLRALAQRSDLRLLSEDQALFTLFATALAAYLSRVADSESVTFGATTSNRLGADEQRTIGLFVELFPLVAEVDLTASYLDLYRALSEESSALLFYGLPGASTPASARAFNVILNYLHMGFGAFHGHETQVRWLDNGAMDPAHALRFNIHDFANSGCFVLSLDVNTDRFDAHLCERIPAHFLRVLDALLEDCNAPIGAVPLAGEDDASILDRTEPVPSSLAGLPTVISLFDEQVARQPEAPALESEGVMVSYALLRQRSEALAQVLAQRGVGVGSLVGICARRSLELVTAVFAVLRAGAAFVPLEPALPRKRLQLIVEDTEAACILVDETGASIIQEAGITISCLSLKDRPEPVPPRTDLPPVDPAAPAYVYYTSGSTGRPKGVMVGHAGLADYISWSLHALCPPGAVNFPLFSAFGFDLTINALFAPFVAGGTLKIYPEPMSGTDLSIRAVMADDAVDVVKLTPSHLALALPSAQPVKRIKTLLFSGEELKTELAFRGLECLGEDLVMINEYGPTEAIVGSTFHRYDPARDTESAVPIGLPDHGAAIYILDDFFNAVPRGVVGEVFIGGERLAQGYLKRAALTAERFLPDPFRPGGRMYRTGDFARWDGEKLNYLGRRDGQVKIRGNRIELGEIEHVVTLYQGVLQAVVTLSRQAQSAPQLVAYFTSDGSVSTDELRSYLMQRLTPAMVPVFLVEIDAIPVTSNGKIDRAALPAPQAAERQENAAHRPPVTDLEQALAGYWCEVLMIESVLLDDNFFELGGDSIGVIQLVERAREAGFRLQAADCFERPTLGRLAAHLESLGPLEPDSPGDSDSEPFGLSGLDQAGLSQVAQLLRKSAADDDS